MSTGTELVTIAQYHFGSAATDTTVPTAVWTSFLNMALQEMYQLLPADQLAATTLKTTASLAFTGGTAAYPAGADYILQLAHATTGAQYLPVTSASMFLMDSNTYLVPAVGGVYFLDTESRKVFMRPTSITSALCTYLAAPAVVTNLASAVTDIPPDYQPSLALLMTSYAYSQEEDLGQSGYYHSLAVSRVQGATTPDAAPTPAAAPAAGPAEAA